jgi:hypothetical protein
MLITDQLYYWQGNGNRLSHWQSYCRSRIFHLRPEHTIVVASDPSSNSGTSILNCTKQLAGSDPDPVKRGTIAQAVSLSSRVQSASTSRITNRPS